MWSLLNTRWKRAKCAFDLADKCPRCNLSNRFAAQQKQEWKGLSPSSNFQHGQRDCKILLVSKAGLMVGNKCFFSHRPSLRICCNFLAGTAKPVHNPPLLSYPASQPFHQTVFSCSFLPFLPAQIWLYRRELSLHFECMRAVLWCIHHNSAPNPLSREVNKYSNC